jgi:DNA polymerase-3 subunit epsilon
VSRQKARPYTLVIDFETANLSPTSACSLGLVVIEDDQIIHTERFLIRTPTSEFRFTHIHGLTWKDVESAPTFADIWTTGLKKWFEKGSLLVAHNVGFDQKVLTSTAAHYQLSVPKMKTECTVKMSRFKLGIKPANLKNVSDTLGIKLNHHEALSDALASAYIYLHVKTGSKLWLKPSAIQADFFIPPTKAQNFDDLFEDHYLSIQPTSTPTLKTTVKTIDFENTLQLNSPKSKEFLNQLFQKTLKKF